MYSIIVNKLREKENSTLDVLIILNHQMQIIFLTWIAKYRQTYRQENRQTAQSPGRQTKLTDRCTQTCTSAWGTFIEFIGRHNLHI